MKVVKIMAVCVVFSLIGSSLGLSQGLTEKTPQSIPEELQTTVDRSNPLLQTSNDCEWLEYPCDPAYYFTIPDAYGDDFFNMRFTPPAPSTLNMVDIYFYNGFAEFSDVSGLGVDIIVWDDDGSGLPGTELARINVPAAQILYYPSYTSVDFSSENLVFSEDFHVGYTVVDQTQDVIAILSDEGLCGQLRSSEYCSGLWGTVYDVWGVDVNFLIYAQVCLAYSSVALDIKPQSCPNPFNTKSKGVLPVAILGTMDFDVSDVDRSSVRLEGVAPVRDSIQDVSTPVDPRFDVCDCTTDGPDGIMDLALKFDRQEILAALQPVFDGEIRVLTLTGMTQAGTPIEGQDCIVIKHKGSSKLSMADGFSLSDNYPNPFNPETEISFNLPQRTQASLVIYNILGEKVKTLVSEEMEAGAHTVRWSGRDEAGNSVASGIYFYRLTTENFGQTKRMILLK